MQMYDVAHVILALPDDTPPTLIRPHPQCYLSHVAADAAVWRCAMQPFLPLDALQEQLHALLDHAAAWLPERPPIACHGMLQDVDTVNPEGMPPRYGPNGELLAICPKPHISPQHVDIVSPTRDCLRNPRLCHILGTTATVARLPPFVRRVLSPEHLVAQVQHMREQIGPYRDEPDESPPRQLREQSTTYVIDPGAVQATDTSDDPAQREVESLRTAIIHAVGEMVDQYMEWRQIDTGQIEEKLTWVFGELWHADAHPRGLPDDVRHMLISGEYVWNEFQQIGVQDWAACAVQYVRALERELHRRLYARCGNPSRLRYYDQDMRPHQFTFGSVSRAYRKREHAEPDPNWQTLVECAALPSGADVATFTALIADIARISKNRNKIAHSERVDKALAGTVRSAVLGQPGTPGVLWRCAALLDPG
jgi:hypothetical protein